METYIALLRGINVSGQKKIKMTDLKVMFEELGYTDVITYIQSGNVLFTTKNGSKEQLQHQIQLQILETFGFDVAVLVFTPTQLQSIYDAIPYTESSIDDFDPKKLYFTFLMHSPSDADRTELLTLDTSKELFDIRDMVIYIYATNGYGKTKLSNTFFEKKLKITATTRNLRTLQKLLALSTT